MRINKCQIEVQTTLINMEHIEVQTEKETTNLLGFINSSLQSLNRLTINNNKQEELIII